MPAPTGAREIEESALCMSGPSQDQVIVVDSEKRFLEYTNPGMARKLLREHKARVFSKVPFAIMLFRTVPTTEINRRKVMSSVRNFTEYFKVERDVYVQNVANAQVSCEFPLGPGRVEGFLFPHNRDPINLSQFIPFNAIKESMDFRKLLSRRPAALQLLNEEEYQVFFKDKAKRNGLLDSDGKPDVEAAIDSSEERRRRTADRNLREQITDKDPLPIHEVVERGTGPGGIPHFGEKQRVASKELITEDDVINPRILHLCNQVKSEIPEEERMAAKDLLESIQEIPTLTMDDYEHIRAHGFYKTVKKWAKQQMGMLSEKDDEEGVSTPA
jgi:hypothetical protein